MRLETRNRSRDNLVSQKISFGPFMCTSEAYKYIYLTTRIWVQNQPYDAVTFFCSWLAMRYVTHGVRRPFGHGQAALLKNRRNSLASAVAQRLRDRLDVDRVQMTGELLPRGSLKKVANRKVFEWIHEIQGRRIYTKPLLKLCVKKLLRFMGPVPLDPKLPYGTYVKQQALRLGSLIRQAKRIKDTWLIWDWILFKPISVFVEHGAEKTNPSVCIIKKDSL